MLHTRTRAIFLGLSSLAVALVLATGALAAPKSTRYGDRVVSKKEAGLIELGRRLFFDPLVSRSGERSCASCHDPEHGFSDPGMVSEDDIGNTVRHSQTILDSHLNPTAHWDGEFTSIEALVTARIGLPQGRRGNGHGAPLSPGTPTVGTGGATGAPGSPEVGTGPRGDNIIEPEGTPFERPGSGRRSGGGYGPDPSPPSTPPVTPTPGQPAEGDTGRPGTDITGGDGATRRDKPFDPLDLKDLPRVQDVLEAGGRYASGFRTAFGSESVTTARIAKAVAAYCRSVRSTPAPFDRYLAGDAEALGESAKRGYALFRGKARCTQCHALEAKGSKRPVFTDFDFHNTGIAFLSLSPEQQKKLRRTDEFRILDRGRERISRRGRDLRAFKTATLRDVGRRGPYMHTGRFSSLEDVVRYYAKGGSEDPRKDKRLRPFKITDSEVSDLVAFLTALSGTDRPGMAPTRWDARPTSSRLRFVDANRKPIAGIEVSLVPVGDLLPMASSRDVGIVRCRTDAKGWIEYVPGARTHFRIGLSDNLMMSQGDLVPDSCDQATVMVPVKGRTILMLRVARDKPMPEQLMVEHTGTLVLPGHGRPTTTMRRTAVIVTGDVRTARYEGWFRTDVPNKVVVRVPGARAHTERDLTVSLKRGHVVTLDLTPTR